MTNINIQNFTHETKDLAPRTPLKPRWTRVARKGK